jgi:hypothetical protein
MVCSSTYMWKTARSITTVVDENIYEAFTVHPRPLARLMQTRNNGQDSINRRLRALAVLRHCAWKGLTWLFASFKTLPVGLQWKMTLTYNERSTTHAGARLGTSVNQCGRWGEMTGGSCCRKGLDESPSDVSQGENGGLMRFSLQRRHRNANLDGSILFVRYTKPPSGNDYESCDPCSPWLLG